MDDYLGAYVLAALEPDEADAVREHLDAGCARCAAEVAALTSTVERLAVLTLEEVEQALGRPAAPPTRPQPAGTPALPQPAEPPAVLQPTGTPGRAHRRRSRYRARFAAAAGLAACATAAGVALSSGPPTPHLTATTVRADDPLTRVTAAVTVRPGPSVTTLHLSMAGAHPGGWCRLVVHGRDGRTDTTSSWAATDSGRADVDARTTIPAAELQSFDVLTDSGQQLVRLVVPHHLH
jgi:hypothetical protein